MLRSASAPGLGADLVEIVPEALQGPEGVLVDRHVADAGPARRTLEGGASVVGDDVVVDTHCTGNKVEVVPTDRARLATAHPGGDHETHGGGDAVVLLLDAPEQCTDLGELGRADRF